VIPETSSFVQRLKLLPRPDVKDAMKNGEYLYSGFETVLPNIAVKKILCIVFSNQFSAQVVYSTGDQC
jgi:hypothetical protein